MSLISFSNKMMAKAGISQIKKVDKMLENPMLEQEKVLMEIINNGKDSLYGKEHHFENIHSIKDFKENIKINDYDDFAPYIEKICKGENNILTTSPVVFFNRTSGTLGAEKKIPLVDKHIKTFGRYNAIINNGLISNNLGYGWIKGKGLSLTEGTYEILPCGLPYGSASSLMAEKMNNMGPFKNLMDKMYSSPSEARAPSKGVLTRYIHARFALMEENITYATCTFSSNLMETFRYIENNHEMLVNDIEKGTIDPSVDLPEDVLKTLLPKCKPMPERAKFLREVFANGFNEPFAKKIWPNFQFIECAAGAGFQPYTDKLLARYLGYDVHVFYLGLSASEGYFSAVSGMDNPKSYLTPDTCFMEFINVKEDDNKTYNIDELKLGECYELIITTFNGFYRYRMKDVIKVTGFKGKTPLVEFQYRNGYAINMFGEKTSELALLTTIKETEKKLNISFSDYCAYADVDNQCYVFLLEIDKDNKEISNEEIRKTIQDSLIIANDDIKEEFDLKHLKDVKILFLQKETFMLYKDLMVLKGASASQVKPVHVILNERQRKFFFGLTEER